MLELASGAHSSHRRESRMRGRGAEREQLAAALEQRSTVVVTGAAGTGRSRMLAEGAVLARRLGLRAFSPVDITDAASVRRTLRDAATADAAVIVIDDLDRAAPGALTQLAAAY